jgi:hypothetical protein
VVAERACADSGGQELLMLGKLFSLSEIEG